MIPSEPDRTSGPIHPEKRVGHLAIARLAPKAWAPKKGSFLIPEVHPTTRHAAPRTRRIPSRNTNGDAHHLKLRSFLIPEDRLAEEPEEIDCRTVGALPGLLATANFSIHREYGSLSSVSSMRQDVVPDYEKDDERKDSYRGSNLPEDLTLSDPQHQPPTCRARHPLPHLCRVAEVVDSIIRSTIVMATRAAIQVPDCRSP